jgi:hypothetical protein
MLSIYIVLIVLAILLFFSLSYKEHFEELISKSSIFVLQGNSIPMFKDNKYPEIMFDQGDFAAQRVDGSNNALVPKQVFPFAFNKCSIDCCNKNSNLTCNSGCVCVTDKQIKNFFNR